MATMATVPRAAADWIDQYLNDPLDWRAAAVMEQGLNVLFGECVESVLLLFLLLL